MQVIEQGPDLLSDLLERQGDLSAVDRFSKVHAEMNGPLYRDLIPLSKPGQGEQYAFEVDLDTCSGCKACVTACHSMNGLDDGESWRDVGLLVSSEGQGPVTVTSACHHCADPACANGCPTLAYEKDAETGIVRHLDDQCIGCSYCEMKCPYGVPKFNERLGIVRKCDMCQSRLAEGEAPACVAACPNEAIRIRVVKTSDIPVSGSLVPGVFDSSYTKPATIFQSRIDLNGRHSADRGSESNSHGHLPLVWMLTLTQFSVGIGLAAAMTTSRTLAIIAAVLGLTGMIFSVTHLGQPSKAWRAFLGLRRSWLSREIVVFGMWMPLAMSSAVFPVPLLQWSAFAVGLLAVFCSAMVYIDTQRYSWRADQSFGRFFGTMIGGFLGVMIPLLALPLFAIFWLERRQFFGSMSVHKMPGN